MRKRLHPGHRLAILAISCLILLHGGACLAQSRATAQRDFVRFIATLWPQAQALGVSRPVFDAAFKDLNLDWSLPDLDQKFTGKPEEPPQRQAEFQAPANYFDEASIAALAGRGRAEARRWRPVLKRIEKRYGVPGDILIALWARESNYGRAAIPYDAVRTLATLSFMGRRPETFRPELLATLEILQRGHVRRSEMKSSWAGAMGLMQMLPSQVLSEAVDFDGDGREDIWGSVPDALASAAKFLSDSGWRRGETWGYEVTLPASVDCTLEGSDHGRSIAHWLKMGLAPAGGRSIAPAHLKDEAYLILPAARFGPAFLGTRNYYVIKTYNNSDLYVIYVGQLADRIAGKDNGFVTPWGRISTYSRLKVAALQRRFLAEGYNIGDTVDGLIGFRTRIATGLYEKKYDLALDCWPGPQVFGHAGVK